MRKPKSIKVKISKKEILSSNRKMKAVFSIEHVPDFDINDKWRMFKSLILLKDEFYGKT